MGIGRGFTFMILLGALVLGHPAVSDAQLVLYDDFSSGLIDPSRWFGSDTTGGSGNPTTEAVRLIKFGKLQLRLDQYGLNNSDGGTSVGRTRLSVTNPTPITTMQAAVTVLSAEAEACSTNTDATGQSRAQIAGGFFNDGSSTGSSDRTGDIIAIVQKDANAALGDVFEALIIRCANSSCSSTPIVTSQQFTATWAPNQPHTLTLTWDAANHQFIYSVKPVLGGSRETITLPYTQSDSNSAVGPFRHLVVSNAAVNCNGSQKHAFMNALFDNVMVNE